MSRCASTLGKSSLGDSFSLLLQNPRPPALIPSFPPSPFAGKLRSTSANEYVLYDNGTMSQPAGAPFLFTSYLYFYSYVACPPLGGV